MYSHCVNEQKESNDRVHVSKILARCWLWLAEAKLPFVYSWMSLWELWWATGSR